MASFLSVAMIVIGGSLAVGFGSFALVSHREREPRARRVAALLGGGLGVPYLVAAFLPTPIRAGMLLAASGIAAAGAIAWFLPIGTEMRGNGRPERRVDEREIMFARARLEPGSPGFEAYYAMHPEHREGDDRTRALPGLLSLESRKAEPRAFAAADAWFEITDRMRDEVDGPVATEPTQVPAAEATARVKAAARELGAVEVGITALREYHLYSHVGRGTGAWGEPITRDHDWAIAFTVEMDHRVMQTAPEAPVVAESARQYVAAARIAVPLAAELRALGYPARAHIDGNYRVIAPLVALDAGLGEIGRMGLLMTPRLGPRVRLGVVTTSLPLLSDPAGDDSAVLDFCAVCRKCAENCPSNSIPFGDREEIGGGLRWQIDSDSCFRYWNLIGTDCGRCMAVCPFSHPDNAAHNLVRWAAQRSGAARQAALWADDLFYGREPAPADPGPVLGGIGGPGTGDP